MNKNNENENVDKLDNNKNLDEKDDILLNLLKNENDFISYIKKILETEFEGLFSKILNLPKIDFLNQLTSNVTFVLFEQISSDIINSEKYISLITSTCHSFENNYNKYMEELTEGWDQYSFEKLNQIQNIKNEKLESFFFTKFRKHCNKTQNYAVHQCNKNGDTGHFIIVCCSSSQPQSSNSQEKNKNKIKYLICDNCRKCFFVHEFKNYCENCKVNYLCGPLIKEENKNFLLATLNPPHCETFINEEILCEKCNNKLYIDMENNQLKCGNTDCDYCVSIENDTKINFKCKNCLKDFCSNVKIFNPIEIVHFKEVVDKALLYKRKAYPGKLSCCSKIKEKRTDFYHKNECKGKIYFAEYNHKILIVCSKCRAVNQYSKFIWTCPECGIHFRDKKSKENEIKIRKTKSSNKLIKSKKLLSFLEEDNYLTLNSNNNKRPLADLLSTRKNNKEKNTLYNSYNFDNITERKKQKKNKLLSEKKLCETDDHIDKNIKINGIQKKKKRKYIIGKILPWGSPRKTSSNNEENNENNNNTEFKKNEEKKEYYDKKVNDLINPKQIVTKIEVNRKIDEDHIYVCRSGRVNYKKNEINTDLNMKDSDNNKIEKGKNLYARRFNGLGGLKNNYDSVQSTKEITKYVNNFNNHNQTSIETNYAFNKMKSPAVRNIKKDNDLKCKKFVPIKLKYLYNTEHETKQENNNNLIKGKNLLKLFESQNIKKLNQIDINIKKDSKNKIINIENKYNKESWQSKETTTKGSIESKNSIISHSPQKDEEDENKKMYKNRDIFLHNDNLEMNNKKLEKDKILEDDIIPEDMVDLEQDIPIENKNIKEDKNLYDNIQRRLKRILKKGRLPRFDLDKYHIDRQIGDGSFGVIFLVHHKKSKNKYAMKKIIANNINSLELYQKEFEIAHHDRHPSILDIKGIYLKCFDATTFVLYVLMDLAERDWEVEINNRLKNKRYYKEKELISILKQLSNALCFLQKEKNVAHRDVKPENVLVFKNKTENKNIYGDYLYKICDFGEAKDYEIMRNKKNKTLRGTELYMSPALYNGLLHDAAYVDHNAYKSDVFSLGCCMIIAASLDFDIINEIRKLKEQIKIEKFLKNKLARKYSEKFIDIILKMINFNEKERIDFVQLEEIIESNF